MKILHTADWHLGKKLENVNRLEEQQAVLDEICEIAEQQEIDVVLVAGDLFDTFNPPTEAVDLFYKTLKQLAKDGQRAVIAIAGNHDSPDRIEAPDPLARECGIFFAGYPNSKIRPVHLDSGLAITQSDEGFVEIQHTKYSYPLRMLLTPYANEYRMKSFLGIENTNQALQDALAQQWQALADRYMDDKSVNLLMTHLFMVRKDMELPEEPEGEKPIHHPGGASEIYPDAIPEQIQYAALGHLHRYQEMSSKPCPVVYSSSPLAYSFSEAGQQKYVVILDAEPGKPIYFEQIPLTKGKPLIRKKVEGLGNALQWLTENQDCLVELTLVTDDFISAKERKQLHNAHPGIITLIPEIKNISEEEEDHTSRIDLQKDITALFEDYFAYKHGQKPDEAMRQLFKEVLASGGNDKDDQSGQ